MTPARKPQGGPPSCAAVLFWRPAPLSHRVPGAGVSEGRFPLHLGPQGAERDAEPPLCPASLRVGTRAGSRGTRFFPPVWPQTQRGLAGRLLPQAWLHLRARGGGGLGAPAGRRRLTRGAGGPGQGAARLAVTQSEVALWSLFRWTARPGPARPVGRQRPRAAPPEPQLHQVEREATGGRPARGTPTGCGCGQIALSARTGHAHGCSYPERVSPQPGPGVAGEGPGGGGDRRGRRRWLCGLVLSTPREAR